MSDAISYQCQPPSYSGNGDTKKRLSRTQEDLETVKHQVGILDFKVNDLGHRHTELSNEVRNLKSDTTEIKEQNSTQLTDIEWIKKLLFGILTISVGTLGTILGKILLGIGN